MCVYRKNTMWRSTYERLPTFFHCIPIISNTVHGPPTFSKWYVKKQTVIATSLFYYVKVMKYGMGNKRETLNKYTALQLQFSNIKYRLYPSIQIISKRWLVWRQLLSIQSFHSFDSSPSSTFFIHNPWALNLLAIPNY